MVILTAASPEAVAALSPGSTDLADETLRHDMVKTLPMFLGNKDSPAAHYDPEALILKQ